MNTRQSLWIDRGLLLARIALGLVFVIHGGQKLFVVGYPAVTGFLGSLGLPFPAVTAALLIATEFGGGLLLLAGALTRLMALAIACDMAVAVTAVHRANGFFLPAGYEYALTLGLISLALMMTGAGKYSVDALLQGRRSAPAKSFKIAA